MEAFLFDVSIKVNCGLDLDVFIIKDSPQRLRYLMSKVEIMALVHINLFYVILCVTSQNSFSAHENRKRLWS